MFVNIIEEGSTRDFQVRIWGIINKFVALVWRRWVIQQSQNCMRKLSHRFTQEGPWWLMKVVSLLTTWWRCKMLNLERDGCTKSRYCQFSQTMLTFSSQLPKQKYNNLLTSKFLQSWTPPTRKQSSYNSSPSSWGQNLIIRFSYKIGRMSL